MEALCPDCDSSIAPDDNYCRNCGMFLVPSRAVVVSESALPAVRPRAALPAPVTRVATAIAVGTALQIGASLAGKYLAAQAARGAARGAAKAVTSRPRSAGRQPSRDEIRAERSPALVEDPVAVSETVIFRRVWIRRP